MMGTPPSGEANTRPRPPDAFHGAFTYGLMQHWPVDDILCFASAGAALNCRQLGGRSNLPNLSEVEDFLANERNAWEAGIKKHTQ